MRGRRRDWLRAGGLTLVAASLVLPSCREPTQITVELRTDVPCASVTETTVGVGTLTSVKDKPTVSSQKGCKTPDGRIGSLVVIPSGENQDEVTIQAILGVDGQLASGCQPDQPSANCVVARRALRFVPHTPLELPIELSASCLGKVCPDDQTCLDGKCVSAKLPDPESCTTPGGCAPAPDAGSDALSVDTGTDSALDAGFDGGVDAAADTGNDAPADVNADGPATTKPLLHYAFEVTTGAIPDSSGNGLDGTPIGATVKAGAGHNASGGLVLTGAAGTSTLQIAPSTLLAAVTQLTGVTIAAWVNLTKAPPAKGFIFANDPAGTPTVELWIEPTRALCMDVVPTVGGTYYPACSTATLTTGTWAHVALSADTASASLYVDGSSVATSKTPAPKFALTQISFFGYGWDGVLDEVRIYDHVLSPAEIAALAKL
ncbi:MAG: LamG domain-containing protein [Myxococcales bacterium]|nr:LamG domain-containing protein [Myxococcales bacterium]